MASRVGLFFDSKLKFIYGTWFLNSGRDLGFYFNVEAINS